MSKFLIGNIKGPKGDKGEQGATGPKGEQGIQGPVGPAGGVNSVNGMTGDVTVEDTQGINLLTGTKDFSGEWVNKVDWIENGTYKGLTVLKSLKSYFGLNKRIQVKAGEKYTFSAYVRATKNVTLQLYIAYQDTEAVEPFFIEIKNPEQDFKRYSVQFAVIKDTEIQPRAEIRGTYENYTDNYIEVCGYKLEKGTVTNPQWSPAPEDLLLKGEVDGRNLFVMADSERGYLSDSNDGTITIPSGVNGERTSDYISVSPGESYTLQSWATATNVQSNYYMIDHMWFSDKNKDSHIGKKVRYAGGTDGFNHAITTDLAPPNAAYLRVSARFYNDGKIKVERGSIATDWTPAPEDVVTKTPPDIFDALDSIPEMHRNIFRGKNLGTVFTDEQKAAIANGSFHDLWVGDYWVINSHTWRIVDINYWLNKGDTACTTQHIVVMPDAQLYTKKMNSEASTNGAYVESDMRKNGLANAKEIVNTDFGEDCVLMHKTYLTNAVQNGHASTGNWYESTVELPNEIMMYGCFVFTAVNNGTDLPCLYTIDTTQLALFRLAPRFINIARQWNWLRDVTTDKRFAGAHHYGNASDNNANLVYGVRPVVGITGGAVAADDSDSDLELTGLSTKGYSDDDLETALSTKGGDPL